MKNRILPYAKVLIFALLVCLNFSASAQGPGGVKAGLRLWLRADMGVTTSGSNVTTWQDKSPASNNVSQANTARQPVYYSTSLNLFNFNPSVYFNATANSLLTGGSMLGSSTYTAFNAFALVSTTTPGTNQGYLNESTATGVGAAGLTLITNGNARFLNGVTATSGPWGGSGNTPYLWSGIDTIGGSRLYRNSTLVGSTPMVSHGCRSGE